MPRKNYPKKTTKPSRYRPTSGDCSDKKRFGSKLAAEQTRAELKIINPDLHLGVYKCLNCGGWHLTRQIANI